MPNESFRNLRLADSVFWVRDKNRTIVIDIENQYTLALHGVNQAIWGWLILDYSYQRILRFVKTALESDLESAEKVLLNALKNWVAAGILEDLGGID